jgi:hypothetical protein
MSWFGLPFPLVQTVLDFSDKQLVLLQIGQRGGHVALQRLQCR